MATVTESNQIIRPMKPQTDCLFLTRLPAELRNEIYALVFFARGSKRQDEEKVSVVGPHGGQVFAIGSIPPKSHPCENDDDWARAQDLYRDGVRIRNTRDSVDMNEGLPSPWYSHRRFTGKSKVTTGVTQQSDINQHILLEKRNSRHPLALLQTCRQIYHEAHLLAFSNFPFPTQKLVTYFELSRAAAPLSMSSKQALRILSYEAGPRFLHERAAIASWMTNTIVIFPQLEKLVVRTEWPRTLVPNNVHAGHNPWYSPEANAWRNMGAPDAVEDTRIHEWRTRVLETAVPDFWSAILKDVVYGRHYRWQGDDEKWIVRWPVLEQWEKRLREWEEGLEKEDFITRGRNGAGSEDFVDTGMGMGGFEVVASASTSVAPLPTPPTEPQPRPIPDDLFNYEDEIGKNGVVECHCGCEKALWCLAILEQGGGKRKVEVEMDFLGVEKRPDEEELRFRLVPGAPRLDVRSVEGADGVRGFIWEPELAERSEEGAAGSAANEENDNHNEGLWGVKWRKWLTSC